MKQAWHQACEGTQTGPCPYIKSGFAFGRLGVLQQPFQSGVSVLTLLVAAGETDRHQHPLPSWPKTGLPSLSPRELPPAWKGGEKVLIYPSVGAHQHQRDGKTLALLRRLHARVQFAKQTYLGKEAACGAELGWAMPTAWLHGCRDMGVLSAWPQRDAVDGGIEHGYREDSRPNAA